MMSLFDVFILQKRTAYDMRISDWSAVVCSSDLSKSSQGGIDLGLKAIGKLGGDLFTGAGGKKDERKEQYEDITSATKTYTLDDIARSSDLTFRSHRKRVV